jgi:hypothetical protein
MQDAQGGDQQWTRSVRPTAPTVRLKPHELVQVGCGDEVHAPRQSQRELTPCLHLEVSLAIPIEPRIGPRFEFGGISEPPSVFAWPQLFAAVRLRSASRKGRRFTHRPARSTIEPS